MVVAARPGLVRRHSTTPRAGSSGDATGRLFRGSGTSQAAAVVSGAAALLLQAYPELTPDQVKAALVSTAGGGQARRPARRAGAGQLDVEEALEAVEDACQVQGPLDARCSAATRATRWPPARGSLEAARGGANLVDPETGAVLSGEVDVQGSPWDGAALGAGVRRGDQRGPAGPGTAPAGAGTGWTADGWSRARWSGETWQPRPLVATSAGSGPGGPAPAGATRRGSGPAGRARPGADAQAGRAGSCSSHASAPRPATTAVLNERLQEVAARSAPPSRASRRRRRCRAAGGA